MTEGFDVALEMSGSEAALHAIIDNMAHGGRIALLGIPSGEIAIDFNRIVFDMLTIKGIYGREMYETWYQMSVMLQSGLDISPVITHRFSYRDHEEAFQGRGLRRVRQGDPRLDRCLGSRHEDIEALRPRSGRLQRCSARRIRERRPDAGAE